MMKYGYGIAALIAFGGVPTSATRLHAKNNDNQPVPVAGGLAETADHPAPTGLAQSQAEQGFKSLTGNNPLSVTFSNESEQEIELFWHDYSGNLVSYGNIAAGGTMDMNTYATHPWSAIGGSGDFTVDTEAVFVPEVADNGRIIYIDDHLPEYRSKTWNQSVPLQFHNASDQEIELFWLNYQGYKVSYGRIGAGQTIAMGTYATHPWVASGCRPDHCTIDGQHVFVPEVADSNRVIEIGETSVKSTAWNHPIFLEFFNGTGEDVALFWHDYSGYKQYYGMIDAGETMQMYTFVTHPWSVAAGNAQYTVDGHAIFTPTADDHGRTIYIDN